MTATRFDASAVRREGNLVVFRASEFGLCFKALVATLKGLQPSEHSDFMLGKFEEGHRYEGPILEELARRGMKVTDRQMETRLEFPGILILGHIDAVTTSDRDVPRTTDAKAVGHSSFEKWVSHGMAAFISYMWQQSIYMLATGLPLRMAFLDKSLVNTEGLFPPEAVYCREYDHPFFTRDQIEDRAQRVIEAAGRRIGNVDCDPEAEAFFCQYRHLGCQGSATGPETAPVVPPEALAAKVARYVAIRTAEDAAGAERRALGLEIRAGMDAVGLGNFRLVDGTRVDLHNTVSTSYDYGAIAKDLGVRNLDQYKTTKPGVRTIRVTAPQKGR